MHKIYFASIEPLLDEEFYQKALSMVSRDRQEKAGQMRQHNDKVRSVAAGLLLNYVLSRNLEYSQNKNCPEEMCGTGPHGKPELPEKCGVHFNLSHSGDYVVCALSGYKVGVDIQRQEKDREKIADRFFHPEEIAYLKEASDRKQFFYDLWCMKESCVKCTGRGMGMGLKSFSTVPLFEGEEIVLDGKRYWGESNPAYRKVDLREYARIGRAENGAVTENYEEASPEGYSMAVVLQMD